MTINCIIIDDEQLARRGMKNFIAELPFLNLLGEYANPLLAMDAVKEQNIDLIFLDINMPKMSGLDFLKNISNPPLTIITSAFSYYALESFELNVIDYLLKPIPFERFVKAVNKAKDYLALKNKTASSEPASEDYFFIKCDKRFEKINYDELLYVEALQNYVILQTTTKRLISYLTFKSVEEYLPPAQFLKVQKSFIVAVSKIDSIEANEIKIGQHSIVISRSNKEEILNAIMNNKLLKRKD